MASDEDWLLIDLNEPPVPIIPAVLSESELAALLGITSSRVRALARDGVLVREGRGRFNVPASIRAYTERLREHAGRAGRPSVGGDDLKAERTRLAREQADKTALQNAAARRELIPAKEAELEWASVLRQVRAGMLAVPSRVSARLGHLSTHDISEIDLEIRDVLAELAEGGADE